MHQPKAGGGAQNYLDISLALGRWLGLRSQSQKTKAETEGAYSGVGLLKHYYGGEEN